MIKCKPKKQIMKSIKHLLIAIASIFLLSSCGDITEEMNIDKNGEGKLNIYLDMSSSMDMFEMMLMMGNESEMNAEDPMNDFFEAMGEGKMDSTMSMLQMAEMSGQDFENPELLKDVMLRIVIDKETRTLGMGYDIGFSSIENLMKINKAIIESDNSANAASGTAGMMGDENPLEDFLGAKYKMSKKEFIKFANPKAVKDENSDKVMDMIGAMGADGTVSTVYNFPYKIKSCSDASAKIDGKKLTIEKKLVEVTEHGQQEDLVVKFKRKFLGIF